MKCPKCGQEMVHINNQYICTACGIVANEFSAKSQVLSSIKNKLEAAKPAPQTEEYVSPTKVALEKNPYEVTPTQTEVPADLSDKTIDQVAKAAAPQTLNQTKPQDPEAETAKISAHDEVYEAVPQEKVQEEPVLAQAEDTRFVPDEGETIIPRVEQGGNDQPPPPQYIQEPQQPVYAAQQNVQPQGIVTVGPSVANQVQVTPANNQMIYPSHEINPILIRVAIGLVTLVLLLVGAYFAFTTGIIMSLINSLVNLFNVQ